MSSKQVRKLKERLRNSQNESEPEDLDDDDPGIAVSNKNKSMFSAQFYCRSSSSESEDKTPSASSSTRAAGSVKKSATLDAPTPSASSQPSSPSPTPKSAQKAAKLERKRRKQRMQQEAKQEESDEFPSAEEQEPAPDPAEIVGPTVFQFPLTVSKPNFRATAEFRRVFGREINTRQQRKHDEPLHYRRLFLTRPLHPVQRPDFGEGALEMVATPEGFKIDVPQHNHRAVELAMEFAKVLQTHDLASLQSFSARHPYHVIGLLNLAEVYNQRDNHEEAFSLVKRALYTLETHFHHTFLPFPRPGQPPNVFLHRRSYATLGRALWAYMHCLNGQGLFGTALEVGKLLLLCQQSDQLLDPIHVFLRVDYFAIRSRKYYFFDEIRPLHLEWYLPNIAFNMALALFHQLAKDDVAEELKDITIADCWWNAPCLTPCTALIRAIILYPIVVQSLLEKGGSDLSSAGEPGGKTWGDLLTASALRNFDTPYLMPDAVTAAFTDNTLMWRTAAVQLFLYRCCCKIDKWCESSVFEDDFRTCKREWVKHMNGSEHTAFWECYSNVTSAECREGADRVLPKVISDSMEEFETFTRNYMVERAINERFVIPFGVVSLQSHPFLVFFHSMLPWVSIERGAAPVRVFATIETMTVKSWLYIVKQWRRFREAWRRRRF